MPVQNEVLLANEMKPSDSTFRFSVVIPTLNEEAALRLCLEALTRMEFPRGKFEVIVVDNGSTDRTSQVATSFATTINLICLQKCNVHISALRNLGAGAARGEILAFLDADCIAPADWLSNAAGLFERNRRMILGAHYRIPDRSSWVARAWYEQRSRRRCVVPYVPGGCLWIERMTFMQLGGFDETIETNEDFEFCARAREAGMPVLAFPELGVTHLGTPQTVHEFYNKQRWHGRAVLTVFLRDVRKLRNAKVIFFAFYTLLCLTGVAAGSIGLLLGKGGQLLAFFVTAILIPALALATIQAHTQKKWRNLMPLIALNLAFAVARALCILESGTSKRSKDIATAAQVAETSISSIN